MRRPCFAEDDAGLASLADTKAESSGIKSRRSSCNYRSISSSSSPRSARFYDARFEENHQRHYLEACFLCKKPLGGNKDIFMYRGDTPFCSEDCRQQQIEIDEAKEMNWNLSSSMKAIRKDQKTQSSPKKSPNYQTRTGTIAAA